MNSWVTATVASTEVVLLSTAVVPAPDSEEVRTDG